MIFNSVPWKRELSANASRLELASRQEWTEEAAFLVEQDIMIGCYAIRKLLESPGKISDEARGTSWPVSIFPLKDRAPDFWDAYDFFEYYDFEGSTSGSVGLEQLCNQVIHSRIFTTCVDEDSGNMNGILVTSDKGSSKQIYHADLDVVIRAFRAVSDDDVVHLVMKRKADGVRHVVKASNSRSSFLPNLNDV